MIKRTNRRVANIIVRGNHAQIQWRNIRVIFDQNTIAFFQIHQCCLDQFGQAIGQVTMRNTLKIANWM